MAAFFFILLAIGVVLTLLLTAAWLSTRSKPASDRVPGWGAALALFVTAAMVLLFSMTTVDARAVGIQTAMGKYQGTVPSGFHLVAPWSSVEEFSTTIEKAVVEGKNNRVAVTYQGGGKGEVGGIARWRINKATSKDGAYALWDGYRNYEAVSTELVEREFRDALLNTANDYTAVDARTAQDDMGAKVKTTLGDKLRRYGIVIDSVSITETPFDGPTQQSLDRIAVADANIETAEKERLRAEKDNETAVLRQKAGALSEQSLTRFCLDVVNAWDVSKNGALPATFNCALGGAPAPFMVTGK